MRNESLALYPKEFSFLKHVQEETLALGRSRCMNKIVKDNSKEVY